MPSNVLGVSSVESVVQPMSRASVEAEQRQRVPVNHRLDPVDGMRGRCVPSTMSFTRRRASIVDAGVVNG